MGYFQRSLRGFGDDTDDPNSLDTAADSAFSMITATDSTGLPIPLTDSSMSSSDQASFNDPNPLSFKVLNGVCYPQTSAASSAAQSLQRQANRVAAVNGYTKIAPDGYLGPATMTLLGQVITSLAGSSCTSIGPQVVTLTGSIQAMADLLGAPSAASASPPPSGNAGGVLAPSGKVYQAPVQTGSILDSFNALSTPLQVGMVALGAGILYMLYTGSKKTKRKR